jgi:hypothetical protein
MSRGKKDRRVVGDTNQFKTGISSSDVSRRGFSIWEPRHVRGTCEERAMAKPAGIRRARVLLTHSALIAATALIPNACTGGKTTTASTTANTAASRTTKHPTPKPTPKKTPKPVKTPKPTPTKTPQPTPTPTKTPKPTPTKTPKPSETPTPTPTPSTPAPTTSAPTSSAPGGGSTTSTYPWHTNIISTTFWVGEIFNPNASDGSQVYSTYDDDWEAHFGGCDGIVSSNKCSTQKRVATNNYFPTAITPKENPFYLDLPYDDINDKTAFAARGTQVPWANEAPYAGHAKDQSVSFMKNRWVKIQKGSAVCYGQIEDAGPGQYHDAAYVFGTNDARPANKDFNNAGMDVSPALNGCLGFAELDGEDDLVSWQFVDAADVPAGPWSVLVTTSGVNNN